MKWDDPMVKLLKKEDFDITGERKVEVDIEVLAEKDCYVSPQQREDKFNDPNKRYKKAYRHFRKRHILQSCRESSSACTGWSLIWEKICGCSHADARIV
ncbi:hypothetical protein AXF42_Ash018813 [Apostasia shenzhenica]|uniref:Uncharacterized protein n=1 Tax=Apostasia shenzhenica TaxID=1088818 RepID=A0A2I0B157_9ASPA|nr:hypothetical protein AXF42_Ash018813 [Apostasia shenzhenica]